MKNGFLKTCSIFLVLVLLFNMLPHQALANMMSTEKVDLSSGSMTTETQSDTSNLEVVEEVTDKRTEYTKEFRMSNGLHLAAVYNEPVHFEENGQWKEIDNTLVASTAKGNAVYTNKAGVWNITFPQQLSANQYVTVTKDGHTLQFGMAGLLSDSGFAVMSAGNTFSVQQANTSSAQIQRTELSAILAQAEHPKTVASKLGSRLQYSNVYSNTNIVYDLQSNTLKESVIINRYDGSLRGYRYTLNVGNMVPVLQEDNSIWFYGSGREEVVMVMPAPFLVDAAKAYNYDVEVSLQGSGGTYTLQYLLPTQWLAAEERAWPVVLDPVITADIVTTNVRDITVAENRTFVYTDPTIQCGYGPNWGRYRFLIKYTAIPELSASDVIVSADMKLYKPVTSDEAIPVEVHKLNNTWDSDDVTWTDSLNFDETIEDFAMVRETGYYYWDVTDIVRDWYANQNTGMLFKIPTELENNQTVVMRQFYSADYSDYSTYMPTLNVYFRNNNGLESYWDYTSATAGRAGTGHVNNYSGNLVWVHEDIGFGGNRMPVSISHIYNSNDSKNNTFGMGYGWRTNFNQRVYQWSKDSSYYIWEDSDGTKHYFKYASAGTYKDEDGLELTLSLTEEEAPYCIIDKNGNMSCFDDEGRLISQRNNQATPSSITIAYTTTNGNLISRVTDGVGRKYEFSYNSFGLLNQITYTSMGSSEISRVNFAYDDDDDDDAYDDDVLKTITDMDGKSATYSYSNHLLTTATDIDGYKLEYTYSAGEFDRVELVKECSVISSDSTVYGGELHFAYTHNQTTITDCTETDVTKQQKKILQFNNWGNTISVQDGEGHAQFAKYATDTNPSAKGNQLTVSSKLQNTVVNLLPNHSFEMSTVPDDFWAGASAQVSFSSANSYYGNKSMRIDTTSTGYARIYCDVQGGTTYTFSAYVKTGNSPVQLKLGGVSSASLAAHSDWTRVQVSFEPSSSQSSVPLQVVNTGSGTTYVDCVQLEETHTASRYNLVENGDFRTSDSWSITGTITTSSDSGAPQLSNNAYKLSGVCNGTFRAYQTIQIGDGKEGDCYVLAGWGKGNAVPYTIFVGDQYDPDSQYNPGVRAFCLQLKFEYTDGTTSDSFSVSFNPAVENWQYVAAPMIAEKDYKSIKVYLAYVNGAGDVWFDGIQLYKERFGVSYAYNANGTLKEVQDINGGTTTHSYDEKENLTQTKNPDDTETNYEYDDYHNLIRMTTDSNAVYEYEYDEYGNNKSVSITSGGVTMRTSADYTDNGNCLEETTDAAGNITYYSYNADTNVLEWVKYPNNDDDTKTTYTYDSMYRLTQSKANTGTQNLFANYAYTDDMLTSITTGSTTYNFTYGNFGLRSSVKVGNTTLATYTYTGRNNYLQTLAYGNGDSVEYTYDNKGRVIQETYEDGDTVTYAYDNDGNLATVTDSATGITTTYYYDVEGRLEKYAEKKYGRETCMVAYEYDPFSRLYKLKEKIGENDREIQYAYDSHGRVSGIAGGYAAKTYEYDGFGRLIRRQNYYGNSPFFEDIIAYREVNNGTTSQIASLTTAAGTHTYTYDANGNITSVSFGGNTTWYAYDSQNQLIREENQAGGYILLWTYDDAGNILTRKKYSYATGTTGYPLESVSYGYGNDNWGDLLTSYRGHAITYDTIGNPLSYYNGSSWTFTWEHGRELATMTGNGLTWYMHYDANGMRTKREISSTTTAQTYKYVYNGSTLIQMTKGTEVLDFFYDAEGMPMAVVYGGAYYYYATNAQGDVVAILNSSGNVVVRYTYDAWGKLLSTTGSMASTLGTLNPLRYRGYVYDTETGFYYLQSRYYDPTTGRFINADGLVGTGQGLLSNNMFAYCGNNPVMGYDPTGEINWRGFFAGVAIATVGAIVVCTAVATGGASLSVTGVLLSAAKVVAGAVGIAMVNTGAMTTYGAATEEPVVFDISYANGDTHDKKGYSVVVDFDSQSVAFDTYAHYGKTTSGYAVAYGGGVVFNYEKPGDYGGYFVDAGATYTHNNIDLGIDACADPHDPVNGCKAVLFTIGYSSSTRKFNYSGGVDYYIPISYTEIRWD